MKKRYTPYPEKEFPVGTVIGIIALIIVIIAIASVVSNYSVSSSEHPMEINKIVSSGKINPDGSITITAYADRMAEVDISYSKGQVISFTATGTITGSTNSYDGANKNVGPVGWSFEPGFLHGRQKILSSAPFMSLLGKIENGEWFYIGKATSIQPQASGEKIYFVFNDADEPVFEDNGGFCTITIKIQ